MSVGHESFNEQKFQFVSIAAINQIQPGKFIDVIGIITSFGIPTIITTIKTQTENLQLKMKIADNTGMIDIICWDDQVSRFKEYRDLRNKVM
ncbi:MAG: hypothetical protein GY928_00850 [Colwellia sp.]|nr:hypothetical protein [Colwellia sp.]